MIKLTSKWKAIARRAWSIRLALVSAVLSGAEVAVQYAMPKSPSGRLAAAAGVLAIAAAIVRLVAQKGVTDDDA